MSRSEQCKRYYKKHKEKCTTEMKTRRAKGKSLVYSILMHYKCQNPDCGWNGEFSPTQLDFHHIDPNQKDFRVSQIYSRKLSIIADEINKCCVLCRNCHAELHNSNLKIEFNKCNVSDVLTIKEDHDVLRSE